MNTKGFTLVELIAIIVVLVAIFLVSFPNILNISKADEEKKYSSMVEDLCLAGKSYIYANMDDFNDLSTVGTKIIIPVEELIVYGNVASDLKNPKTNEYVKKHSLTYTVMSDLSLDCNYKDI